MKTFLWVAAVAAVIVTAAAGFVGWQNRALRTQPGRPPTQVCEAQAQFNQQWTRIHTRPGY